MLKRNFIFIISLLLHQCLSAQVFEKVNSDLRGVMEPLSCWISTGTGLGDNAFLSGEYYKGDQQFLYSGLVRQQKTNQFYSISNPFPELYRGAVASADYNKDGNADIIMSGLNKEGTLIIGLYKGNDDNTFTHVNQLFVPVIDGWIDWGDMDNDDDLDLIITGKEASNQLSTRIYRNDSGQFTELANGIPGIYNGTIEWGDLDQDKDLDILITGSTGNKPFTAIYRNEQNQFYRLTSSLANLKNSAAAWGDLDSDGRLDILLSGENTDGTPVCMAFKNEGNTYFRELGMPMRPLKNCTIDLGDYDHDGDPDVVMTGESLERSYTLVYENKGGFLFEPVISGIPGVGAGNARWGDFDGDGDLDLLVAGLTICYDFIGQIYRNNINPVIESETESLFIDAPMPNTSTGPYYYYVFSSCYCDPEGGDNIDYHVYISNVHLQKERYELNHQFNDLLISSTPNWGNTDRGYRTSNGFVNKKEAEEARTQLIESYKVSGYQVHYINW